MGLKELRMKRGLTQQQLAEKIGVTRQRVAAFETGARKTSGMSLEVAIRICDVLKVRNPRKLLDSDSETSAD
jgi:DNA-binding XRE family transcriptional regulator